jgi:hypothetical protein
VLRARERHVKPELVHRLGQLLRVHEACSHASTLCQRQRRNAPSTSGNYMPKTPRCRRGSGWENGSWGVRGWMICTEGAGDCTIAVHVDLLEDAAERVEARGEERLDLVQNLLKKHAENRRNTWASRREDRPLVRRKKISVSTKIRRARTCTTPWRGRPPPLLGRPSITGRWMKSTCRQHSAIVRIVSQQIALKSRALGAGAATEAVRVSESGREWAIVSESESERESKSVREG